MNFKHFIYSLLLVALIWSCTKDDTAQITPNDTESFALTTDPQLEQELQQLLEQAKNGLNASPNERSSRRIVLLPAGSVNALQSAVRAANGGIVYIRAGEHRESGTVTIDRKVTILSEKGAVLIVNTQPSALLTAIPMQPALHIRNAPGTHLSGLEIRPQGAVGNTGILVENSPNSKIMLNKITDHQFSIVTEKSDKTTVYFNRVVSTPVWQTGQLTYVQGIINVNGEGVRLISNDVSNGLVGIWACSDKGLMLSNKMHGDYIGLLLCKVPDNFFKFPDSHLVGSQNSGNNWLVTNNNAVGNFDVGYLVIDGAHHNLLENNFASANARVDNEVSGDSNRFGFFTPKAFNNTLHVKSGQTVKDCGVNSIITGGVRIDTNAVPCF